MHRSLLLLALLLASPLPGGESTLLAARRARELLGPEVWSEVVRIQNRARPSDYPRTVYATVFELGGVLWFYSSVNGTQSLSLHRNNLAAEKADLTPLLRAIESGFTRYSLEPSAGRHALDSAAALPNGCFIESYVALRERLQRGEELMNPRLLAYYVDQGGRRRGHTVLVYETPHGLFVLDPAAEDRRPRQVSEKSREAAPEIAALLRPDLQIAQARWVPVPLSRPEGGGSALRHAHADKAN